MIDRVQQHIREHAASWGVELPASARLRMLLRANPENDGIVREIAAGQVGTLAFWFRPHDTKPCLVSKFVGASLTAEAIAECTNLQESANEKLGYRLFPRIYSIAEVGSHRVVFMEAVDGPNYEIQLARAVHGPERSTRALERVVAQLFQELGTALRGLQAVTLSGAPVKWGAQATDYARRFLKLCPEAGGIVSEASIAATADLIDAVALREHFVLTEDHITNYLPGPRAVDQLVPDIRGLCARWPGPVDGLRMLVAFFRASPIRQAFADYDWLDALASCLAGEGRIDLVGTPVRRFLDDIGLKSATAQTIWAFVTGVFFMRAIQELEFHADNAIAGRLRNEFAGYARDVIRIGDELRISPDGSRRLAVSRLDKDQLDGEFRDRDHADFHFSPNTRVFSELIRWLPPALRIHHRIRERHPRLYRAVRRILGLARGALRRLSRR